MFANRAQIGRRLAAMVVAALLMIPVASTIADLSPHRKGDTMMQADDRK